MAKKLPDKKAPKRGEVGVDYARYSSHNQKDASIEQQVAACQEHAAKHGIKLFPARQISDRIFSV